MCTSIKKVICVSVIAAVAAFSASAQEVKTEKPAAPAAHAKAEKVEKTEKAEKKAKGAPFKGIVASVDKVAKTVTLEGPKAHVLQVTSQTKITKEDKPAVFDDIAAGIKVTGYQKETAAGKWDAVSLKIGAAKVEKKAK